jgi:hypothetical protein
MHVQRTVNEYDTISLIYASPAAGELLYTSARLENASPGDITAGTSRLRYLDQKCSVDVSLPRFR